MSRVRPLPRHRKDRKVQKDACSRTATILGAVFIPYSPIHTMEISEIALPKQFLERVGIKKLNPPQAASVQKGLLEGKNLVVASPTASGKTAIAELAIIRHYLNGGKTVYLAPLRALASEKYEEFKKKYEPLGIRVALSIGDYDSAEDWLGRYDVIILTNEKMDSLIRNGATWIRFVTLIVVDEIHVLGDPGRGPTLEVVLTRLRKITGSQILALSATISNADEIAKWLGASLVRSDWRPVKLYKGVFYPTDTNGTKYSYRLELDGRTYDLEGNDAEEALEEDTIMRGKQALVFVSTRRYAEAFAEKAAKIALRFLKTEERQKLKRLSQEVESALPFPTRQCRRLAKAVAGGAAFHHAGLVSKQRKLIEDSFRSGLLKVIAATPTLAFGVNLPAWRVVIRDARRFGMSGMDWIPSLEVMQMMGRAGRPAFDTEGEAVIVARTDSEAEELKDRFLRSDPEPIESKLAQDCVLRMHTLALIATEAAKTREGLMEFFSRTFFGLQFGLDEIRMKIDRILEQLEEWKFVQSGEEGQFVGSEFRPAFALTEDVQLKATILGKRVAGLYIDPLTGASLVKACRALPDIAYLMTITQCAEMQPLLRPKKVEYEDLAAQLQDTPIKNVPEAWSVDYDDYLAAFKTSLFLQAWMDEASEDQLLERFGIPPGEAYNKISSAEWLCYAGRELALLLQKKDVANNWNRLLLRVHHGVREELLQLVKLKGIGRARARMLFKSRIKSAADVRRTPEHILAEILGPKIARSLKEEAEKGPNEKSAPKGRAAKIASLLRE